MQKYKTREEWLEAAVEVFRPRFDETPWRFTLPPKVRVSIGFPPKGAMSKKKTVLGVCTKRDATTDHIPQVYLSPIVAEIGGKYGILAILLHELIHACGIENHGKDFKRMGEDLGLECPMECSTASLALQLEFEHIMELLGDFPHAPIIPELQLTKPDKCRIHKCICAECGYTVRVAKKWINISVPDCPVCRINLMTEVNN
jgi:hypothetical protein